MNPWALLDARVLAYVGFGVLATFAVAAGLKRWRKGKEKANEGK